MDALFKFKRVLVLLFSILIAFGSSFVYTMTIDFYKTFLNFLLLVVGMYYGRNVLQLGANIAKEKFVRNKEDIPKVPDSVTGGQ